MKVPYKLSREEFRAYLFSRVESKVNELAGKRLGLNKADVDFIESIRKADRRAEPLLNKSELLALFVHHAEEDCEKWIPEGQVCSVQRMWRLSTPTVTSILKTR